MRASTFVLAALAAISLVACGKKSETSDAPRTEASAKAAKAAGQSPLDLPFNLKGGEEINVDEFLALLADDEAPAYEAVSFDDKLGATIVTNLVFADSGDGERVTIARAELYGVDMDAITEIKANNGGAADAPFKTVFEKVRLFDVKTEGFDEAGAFITIGAIEFDRMDLRESGFKGDGIGDDGARAVNATRFGGVYFKDIALSGSNDEGAPAVGFSAPDLRFVGIGGGKIDAVIANSLAYSVTQSQQSLSAMRDAMGPQGAFLMNGPFANIFGAEQQRGEVETFEWRGIDVSGVIEYGLKDEEPKIAAEKLMDLGAVKVTGATTFINDKRFSYLEEATVSAMEFTWFAPSKFRADTKGALYDFTAYVPDAEEDALATMKSYGLDKVTGDGFFEYIWDHKSGGANLDYVANTKDFASLSANLEMSGFKLDEIAAAREAGEANPIASLGKLDGLSVKVADEKALDALFALSALQMGGSGDDLRKSAPAMIRLSGAQAAQLNPKFTSYVNALADFVSDGGSLEIKAKPAEPLALSALQSTSPQTLPDLLALEVVHAE